MMILMRQVWLMLLCLKQCKHFKQTHFSSIKQSSQLNLNILENLKKACDKLNLNSKDELEQKKSLETVYKILCDTNDLSSFEIMQSGLIQKLNEYLILCNEENLEEEQNKSVNSICQQHLKNFLSIFLPSNDKQKEDKSSKTFSTLVSKLNSCLTQVENFEINLYDVPPPVTIPVTITTTSATAAGASTSNQFGAATGASNLLSSSSSNSVELNSLATAAASVFNSASSTNLTSTITTGSSQSTTNSNNLQTSALHFFNTHQIKCQLSKHVGGWSKTSDETKSGEDEECRAENEKMLRDWKGGLVKIDALAMVSTIEKYLLMRGILISSSSSSSSSSAAAAAASSSSSKSTNKSFSFNRKSKSIDNPTASSSSSSTSAAAAFASTSKETKSREKKEKWSGSRRDEARNVEENRKSGKSFRPVRVKLNEKKSAKENEKGGKSKKRSKKSRRKSEESRQQKEEEEQQNEDEEEDDDVDEQNEEDEKMDDFEHEEEEENEDNEMIMSEQEDEESDQSNDILNQNIMIEDDDVDEDDDEDLFGGDATFEEEDDEEEEIYEEDDDDDDEEDEDNERNIQMTMNSLLFSSTLKSKHLKLQLLLNNTPIPSNVTIYQALKQFGNNSSMSSSIWTQVHQITYRLVKVKQPVEQSANASKQQLQKQLKHSNLNLSDNHSHNNNNNNDSLSKTKLYNDFTHHFPHLKHLLKQNLSSSATTTTTTPTNEHLIVDTIYLLTILNELNRSLNSSCLSRGSLFQSEFSNVKLTSKANRQLQDPLVILTGHLPAWLTTLMHTSPFLFSFQTKLLYLFQTSLDRDRALQKLIDLVPDLNLNSIIVSATAHIQSASSAHFLQSSGPSALSSNQHQHHHHHLNNLNHSAMIADRLTPKLDKKKKTVNREADLLKQCDQILSELGSAYSSSSSSSAMAFDYYKQSQHQQPLLEIQYENEVGTGLGPTLEFYSLCSLQLTAKSGETSMWRTHTQDSLFPAPTSGSNRQEVATLKQRFKLLGKFMAKALIDSRFIDLSLSSAFYKSAVFGADTLTRRDLVEIDPQLAKSLSTLEEYESEWMALQHQNPAGGFEESSSSSSSGSSGSQSRKKRIIEREEKRKDLEEKVNNLCLDFSLPGFGDSIELKKGGRDISVTIQNLSEYIRLVYEWTLIRGVHMQMDAFREGFNCFLSIDSLKLFYPEELDNLFCGSSYTKWDKAMLAECTRCDHGYRHDSRAVQNLFDILCSFNKEEQRLFLQFVTGSPRLPIGGLRSLSPQLTIVKKTHHHHHQESTSTISSKQTSTSSNNSTKQSSSSNSNSPSQSTSGNNDDMYLPSVMTCVNYLKLPDYSSIEVMREKLMRAMSDGQLSFHLS